MSGDGGLFGEDLILVNEQQQPSSVMRGENLISPSSPLLMDNLEPSTTPGTAELPSQLAVFSLLDYSVFSTMLAMSALIGIYFAFFAKQKQNTTSEYLMGGKNMGIFPVSMSLIASYISGITLLGMPAEIYVYGTQYWSVVIAILLMSAGCGVFFLPVFYKLQLNTSYEYLQLRFDRRVRLLGSFLYIISTLLYIPIVIYIPALAFSQVTGVNLHLVTPLVCLVCIFYTSLGGMKAVVWTDALQTILMFGGAIVVVVVGTIAVGGFEVVWQRSEMSERIEFFNMDMNPTVRHTFWNIAFGSFFSWITHISVNQGMVQRFLAMPSINKARTMLVIFCIGVIVIVSISCYTGLLIYATYHDCDRVTTKIIHASDQLLPYFVMDVTGFIPGLPGLFMAGVFSAALSSMSTGLNSMAGVIFEDYVKPRLSGKVSEGRASFMMKVICALIGVFCVAMVFLVEKLGGVLQVSGSLGGVTNGPMLGIFTLGMFFPWANSIGTFVGGVAGLLVMSWISFGTQAAIAAQLITFPKKPVSVDGCTHLLPDDMSSVVEDPLLPVEVQEEPMSIYHLSYTLYSLTGLVVVLTVGLLVSYMTGFQDPDELDLDLLTPPIQRFFRKKKGAHLPVAREDLTSKSEKHRNGDVEDPKLSEALMSKKEQDEDKITTDEQPCG
ncbi:sodium-coupled monocarboxylate transporter 1-like [Neocloeon triangulifer]|uniref:sodium-coupled monocarboxylate transporter 1-like n=1 Tax=Neocloeon triangulifer TaxID=2078957 RepID=UPI00286ED94A|nr:sodium-coupled monocarboxylate transporter 1-like [Neocloeon triangulifer]